MTRATGGWKVLTAFHVLALALVVAGFPFVAALSEIIDVQSTTLSIAMRALTALICAILVLASAWSQRGRVSRLLVLAGGGLWLLYLLRMVNDTLMESEPLLFEPSSYWLWAIGGCIVPFAGLARAKYHDADSHAMFRWCFGIVFAAGLLALPSLSTAVEGSFGDQDTGRAGLTALNSISLGHLGVQLTILSLWALFLRARRTKNASKIVFVLGTVLGLYLALTANSRGPLVSLVVALILAMVASNQRRKVWLVALGAIAAAAFVPAVVLIDSIAGTAIYDRLLGNSVFEDVSRADLYSSAWALFTSSPITGAGLEDPAFGGYPHNLVIEAFMATGIVGGLLMIAVTVLTMFAAFRVLRAAPDFGFLALLAVQQIIASQFSGSISQATMMWGLVGALASVPLLAVARANPKPISPALPERGGSGVPRAKLPYANLSAPPRS